VGIEGKEGRGRSHEGKQGATGGDKMGRSWRSKSIIEGRDGDLSLKRGISMIVGIMST
jgi:hypothetical protein